MSGTVISYELRERVALITIDDGKANAVTHTLAAELREALARARNEAGAVVIAGRPGRFSAGFDLAVMTSGAEQARDLLRAGAEVALDIFEFPMPVVLAVTGHALAMGAILLLAADHRIGAEGAFKIGLNEVAIGMPVPSFAVELARECLTTTAFTTAINHAQIYDPPGAVTAGYLNAVVPADAVVDAAVAHAAELADRLRSGAFAVTRTNCRGAAATLIASRLESDIASFVVELPAD
ncbi:MAG: crotonase/enoyl-CoA hydratase family protein [Acidobacteria bacterium]|nr:crotonase/enoyl-CoA hydratase family protein [Acidobacteriota bacterium]